MSRCLKINIVSDLCSIFVGSLLRNNVLLNVYGVVYVYIAAGHQLTCQAEVATPAVETPEKTSEASADKNSPHSSSEVSPSSSVYDDFGNVIADEDEVTAADSQQSVYDGLQQSSRDVVTQTPSDYEKIRSDTAAAATGSDVTTHHDKQTVSIQTVGDDGMNAPRLSTASTRSAPVFH